MSTARKPWRSKPRTSHSDNGPAPSPRQPSLGDKVQDNPQAHRDRLPHRFQEQPRPRGRRYTVRSSRSQHPRQHRESWRSPLATPSSLAQGAPNDRISNNSRRSANRLSTSSKALSKFSMGGKVSRRQEAKG